MKRKTAGVLTALAALIGAGLLVSAAGPSATEPDFKAMQEQVDRAWCSLDAKNAAAFYDQDPGDIFFDLAPMKYEGWGQYQAGAQKLFLNGAKSVKFTPKGDDRVTRRGDVAWMTRTLRIFAEMKEGKPLDIDCRDTVLWVKRGGKWLIAHEHVSVPLPG